MEGFNTCDLPYITSHNLFLSDGIELQRFMAMAIPYSLDDLARMVG